MHMLHIYVHTRCMFYIHKLHAGLLDSEDEEPAEDMPEQPIEVEPPDGAPEQDQPVTVPAPPQPEVAVAPLRLPDMRTVMQRTGGPDYEDMIREIDDHMGPDKHLDVPSDSKTKCLLFTLFFYYFTIIFHYFSYYFYYYFFHTIISLLFF